MNPIEPKRDEKQNVTMEDIARATGLSKMTVSRALTNNGYVSKETRQKILTAAQQLNYEFNFIGRQLNQNRTGMLGIITPLEGLIGTYYFGQIVKGIHRALAGSEYHIAHYDSLSGDFNDGKKCAQLCYQKRVDGLIVIAPRQNDRFIKTFSDLQVPLVVIGSSPSNPEISYIDVDNYGGARMAVEHLIELGHRKIGFVRGPQNLNDSCERERAFHETMARHRITPDPAWILEGNYDTRDAFHACYRLLSDTPSKQRPTAIFAANDMMALGVLDAARILGLDVPSDLSVVGFDNIDAASSIKPSLTTVRQPMQRLGKKSAEYLVDLLSNSSINHVIHEKLSAQLVVRSSTRSPARRNQKASHLPFNHLPFNPSIPNHYHAPQTSE